MTAADALAQGRDSYGRQNWGDAYAQLSAADRQAPLASDDLERLATAAFLLGRDADSTGYLGTCVPRPPRQGAGRPRGPVRVLAGFRAQLTGETARTGGWLARAERLLDGQRDCVEQGYRLVLRAFQNVDEGDNATAYATFARIAEVGERFGDPDLVTLAGIGRGQALIGLGETAAGLASLDEGMVGVTAGEECWSSSGSSTAS